jgi:alkanesulfonate monooxygenase SsuD/methylene tetrahydromethanopterin reductase-like flavin-dependent oxidoreductase (luciferase family)
MHHFGVPAFVAILFGIFAGCSFAQKAADNQDLTADELAVNASSLYAKGKYCEAATMYRKFLADWTTAGWPKPPKIAYCTIVYVDESDERALDVALARAARAYEGFLPPPKPGETFEDRVREHAKKFIGRGEPGASEIMANLFDADYLIKHELVFIGSPDTVAKKIHAAAGHLPA